MLVKINEVLGDAVEKQTTNQSVKTWLANFRTWLVMLNIRWMSFGWKVSRGS